MGNQKKSQRISTHVQRRNSGSVGVIKGTPDTIRHVLLPPLPVSTCFVFHAFKLSFCLVATFLQYLNLYRTVWWLPHSWKQTYLIDFDSIDMYLLGHILLLLIAPALFEFCQTLYCRSTGLIQWYSYVFFCIISFSAWVYAQVIMLDGVEFENFVIPVRSCGIVVLIYLPVVYFIVYYTEPITEVYRSLTQLKKTRLKNYHFLYCDTKRIHDNIRYFMQTVKPKKMLQMAKNFLAVLTPWAKQSQISCANRIPRYCFFFPIRYAMISQSSFSAAPSPVPVSPKGSKGAKLDSSVHGSVVRDGCMFYTTRTPFRPMIPLKHNYPKVSQDSSQVRDEVELLFRDFNVRLTDCLLGTFYSTFYCNIVPCLFIRSTGLNYDFSWCLTHTVVCALTLFLMHWQFLLPPAYLDLFHRSALHLGGWESIVGPSGFVHWQAWSQLRIYAKDVQVKHIRGLFRSLGASNAAEPCNQTHKKFFNWFHSPTRIPNLLCGMALVLVLGQMVSLEWVFEWYKLLSIAATSPFCLVNLYRLLRNRILLSWIYEDDNPLYDFCCSGVQLNGVPPPVSASAMNSVGEAGPAIASVAAMPALGGQFK